MKIHEQQKGTKSPEIVSIPVWLMKTAQKQDSIVPIVQAL